MMESKRCFWCGNLIPPNLRSDAVFCDTDCKHSYDRRAREIGRKELTRQARKHANVTLLLQAKPDALVTVKSLADPPTYFSGRLEFFYPALPEITLRTKEGRPLVANLRDVEIVLRLSERVDTLEVG